MKTSEICVICLLLVSILTKRGSGGVVEKSPNIRHSLWKKSIDTVISENHYMLHDDAAFGKNRYFKWYGSSPFCSMSNECPTGLTEITVASSAPEVIKGLPNLAQVLPFGKQCVSGQKVLCSGLIDHELERIRSPNLEAISGSYSCVWFGTAPFCDGICPEDMIAQMQATDDPDAQTISTHNNWGPFGSRCWTGVKILCCKQADTNDVEDK
ncbi:unnamed protein product [Notodromas monacha]|uniref:Uncharacterized protein n=1 Tax=Notodromas monacha TaxID=399045 RepID=A0A7R9BPI4_9CRUS|nr:unnamed protein product [Notodromas monacha]CAG0919038.1 unnamed protein product [Notodromas monacha]